MQLFTNAVSSSSVRKTGRSLITRAAFAQTYTHNKQSLGLKPPRQLPICENISLSIYILLDTLDFTDQRFILNYVMWNWWLEFICSNSHYYYYRLLCEWFEQKFRFITSLRNSPLIAKVCACVCGWKPILILGYKSEWWNIDESIDFSLRISLETSTTCR